MYRLMHKKRSGTGFQPVRADFQQTQRNLPHWQMGGSTYFVTFRTKGCTLPLAARRLVLEACRYFDDERFTLWTAVVMPDHVHLLLQPEESAPGEWWPLSSILHSIKTYTAREVNRLLGRSGQLWLDESFDRLVRGEEELLEKWKYIRMNPVKKGLCETPEQWDAFYERTGKRPVPLRF